MNGQRRYFGTDGIRGRVGTYPITPDFALRLGWAVGKTLAHPGAKILIGKDTRRSGYMFESALEAGLTAAGMDVFLLGPMPTPAVAYLTRTLLADLGIVISASHNPHHDNGIKFFSADGAKLSDAVEMQIEALLDSELSVVAPEHIGKVKRMEDASGRYIEFCKSTLPPFQRLDKIKAVVDCANGATYHIAPDVLRELGADLTVLAVEPNGFNINANVGSTSPETLQQKVLERKADIGIALDGDGDRVIMVDHLGTVVDGDEILYVIAKYSAKAGRLNGGGVVGTHMSNYGLELALKQEGIPFIRTKVGDRYVMEMLREKKWHLGGEASGHIIWLNSTTTGDGIVAALQVLSIMQQTGLSLRDLLTGMEKLPQTLVNISLVKPLNEEDWQILHHNVKLIETKLSDCGRVLLRPSGTEPLIRVMVEGQDDEQIKLYAEELARLVTRLTQMTN